MSEVDSETTTEVAQDEVAISELRAQEELDEHEFIGSSLSYVNESGADYSVVRVKMVLPTLDSTELEWEDTRYKVEEVSVRGEVDTTKKAIAEMVRGAERHDLRMVEVGSVEEQPRPGVEKEEFPTYRLEVLYDTEHGRMDSADEE
jgi:hypothetical protein